MKVTYNGIEYQCDSALRGGDYVLLFSSVLPTVSFFGVVNFEEFELEGGEWTYPYVTLDKNNWDGAHATGMLKITGTKDTDIPQGTVFTAQSKDYVTTHPAGISQSDDEGVTYYCTVEVRCTVSGSRGNLYGTENFTYTGIEGITQVQNVGNILGGNDNPPFTQTVEFVGVTSTNDIIVAPRIETVDELEVVQDAQVMATGQGLNKITFTAFDGLPSNDIKMNIKTLI